MEIPDTDAPSMVEERGWRFCLQEAYETSEDKNQVKENSTGFFVCRRFIQRFTFLVLSSQFPKSRLFSLYSLLTVTDYSLSLFPMMALSFIYYLTVL